jgi:hypothetical protein
VRELQSQAAILAHNFQSHEKWKRISSNERKGRMLEKLGFQPQHFSPPKSNG